MSNNSPRGNNSRNNNSRNTNSTSPRNQNQDPKKVWVVRPSFTVGDCRVYGSKEDAFKNFGQPEDSWQFIHDYDIDRNQDGEVWINDKSPSWDNDFEVQWTLEEIEVRTLTRTPTPTPVVAPKVEVPVVPKVSTEESSNAVSDEN